MQVVINKDNGRSECHIKWQCYAGDIEAIVFDDGAITWVVTRQGFVVDSGETDDLFDLIKELTVEG
jgi:hypothetical protein